MIALLVLELWKIEKQGRAGGIRAGRFPPLNRHFAWAQEGRRRSCCNLGLTSLTRPPAVARDEPSGPRPAGAGLERERRDASTSVRADSIARRKRRFRDSWRSGRMSGLCFEEVTTDPTDGIGRFEFRAGHMQCCSLDALRCAPHFIRPFLSRI